MSGAKLRLLMTADAVGGVWQYSTDLALGLSELGVETVLAVLGPSPSEAQAAAAEAVPGLTLVDTGLPLEWLAETGGNVRAAGDAVARLAAARSADIVQLNTPALAAEARFGRPVVAVAHSCVATWWSAVKRSPIDPGFAWRAELTGKGLEAADCVVAPTAAFGEAVRRAYGLGRAPVTVHNGRSLLPLPRAAAHDFAFTAGRLWDKAKNVATLDAAAKSLAVPLYAAGPLRGPNGDRVALDHVRALGEIGEAELARWLAARPVYVSSAVYEPFGLAVLEAASAGCPLVLSDIPTFRELWGGVAAFVDPGDPAGFAEIVGLIVGDDFARAEMGRQARERAARYSVERMAGRMADIYRGLLAETAVKVPSAMAAA